MLPSLACVATSAAAAGDGRFDPLTPLQIIQDTAVRPAPHALLDSVVVDPVLPDPLVPVVQWIFQRPPWVMQAGIVLGAIVALVALFLAWRWRRAIAARLRRLTQPAKLALVGSVAAVALLAALGGWQANNYMMHDNDFCRGCHIFVPSGRAFVKPDTGTYLLVNALEGKHDTLSCHACHPFDIVAQTRELYFWIMDRPEDIPPHGKVPRDVCEQCHVQGDARDTWQRIASTAGHRTHLESDSVLRIVTSARAAGEPGHGEGHATGAGLGVGCLTCHATSAHRFQPADSTCAQQGCHLTSEIDIRLGKMADQAGLHCNVCHQFTADVPLLATRDSAAGTLTPAREQCLGCHQMRSLLAEFDPAADPHGGTCGMCHNPHTQVRPADALKSCADGQCHADWRAVAFHTGRAHRQVAEQCQTCHDAHQARVDASDCTGCHSDVQKRSRGRIRPPAPFDTLKALERASLDSRLVRAVRRWWPAGSAAPAGADEAERPRGKGDAPPVDDLPAAWTAEVVAAAQDTFSHRQHRKLACLTCHDPNAPRSVVTFEAPRGCQICHHQAPARSRCTDCHESRELEDPHPTSMTVAVEGARPEPHAPRERTVPFAHPAHAAITCTECHTAPVSLEPPAAVRECRSCHEQHHEPSLACATCHRTDATLEAHAKLEDPHRACASCHAETTVAALQPTRPFCLGCHPAATDHYAPRECSVCHFLSDPAALRPRLSAGGAR